MLTTNIRNTNGTYGPTKKGKLYQAKADHGINARISHDKTRWAIPENQQLTVFEIAESPCSPNFELYCDENNCYFSVVNDCSEVLGQTNERVAKFPKPRNTNDPWHGYPVKCIKLENIPCDSLLDIMVNQQVISKTTRTRIERKKL